MLLTVSEMGSFASSPSTRTVQAGYRAVLEIPGPLKELRQVRVDGRRIALATGVLRWKGRFRATPQYLVSESIIRVRRFLRNTASS